MLWVGLSIQEHIPEQNFGPDIRLFTTILPASDVFKKQSLVAGLYVNTLQPLVDWHNLWHSR